MLRHNILAVIAIAVTGMSSCVSGPQLYRGEKGVWDRSQPLEKTKHQVELIKDGKPLIENGQPVKLTYYTDPNPYNTKIRYARSLAEYYMEQAGFASGAKDAVALGLIAAAGVATGGLLYDANVNLIKGAGLAAGSLTVLNNYGRPQEAEATLLTASEALICIADAADGAPELSADPAALGALNDATFRVRLNVRNRLSRKIIDYNTLMNTFKEAARATEVGFDKDRRRVSITVEELKDRFSKCIAPTLINT